ncbi:MAG TPA: type IV pilus assembly protein PilM [Solirubrobacterales bacterium]|nr:type IV pilus assembly protein PilM [Solirubrobacterales bacterium]
MRTSFARPNLQLQLTRKKKSGGIAGLDIEAGSIAATEVSGSNGSTHVTASAIQPLDPGTFHEGEVLDPDRLASALKTLFSQHKLSKKVRLGVGNQRVVVRTLRLPAIEDPKEMEAAVRFQAQEQIPMPLDQAVLEHQIVGGVAAEEGASPQVDVVVVAARRDMVSSFIEPIRRAGLEPVGVDLSAFAMIRALADASVGQVEGGSGQRPNEAVLYCNVGDVTNLAVARGRSCLFTRVSHAGLEAMAERLAAARGLSAEHAVQWLTYVGLEHPLEHLDGDPETVAEARAALEEGVAGLLDELRLSPDYYGAQEGALPVERIVLSGAGGALAGLSRRMEENLGRPIAICRPHGLASFDEAAAARLTLSYGLALES